MHEYPEQPGDLGSCRSMGMMRLSEGGGRCECAGEEVMGPFPEPPRSDMPFFDVCRHVNDSKTASSYDHVLLDLFSASAVVGVYNALNATNKTKFVEVVNNLATKSGPGAAMSFVWKLVK